MEELEREIEGTEALEEGSTRYHEWGAPRYQQPAPAQVPQNRTEIPASKPDTTPAGVFEKPKIEQPSETPQQIIKELHNAAIVHQVREDEETKERFLDQAKKSVANELESLNQENITHLQKTTYDANADACKNYGVEESVPIWEIRLMKAGSAFWFVIYWFFASVTICPISVFTKGIRAFIKSTWLAITVAVIAYLIIAVGIPVLITWINSIK